MSQDGYKQYKLNMSPSMQNDISYIRERVREEAIVRALEDAVRAYRIMIQLYEGGADLPIELKSIIDFTKKIAIRKFKLFTNKIILR
jgi:hypothetical protein